MPELEYRGLRYATHTEVYAPHDDTWLLVDAVHESASLQGKTVVEVGCGAGLGLLAAVARGAKGIGVDRNPAAVRLAQANAQLNDMAERALFIRADLASSVDLARVDLLLFNPPYLPTAAHERLPGDLDLAFDGGPTGNETILRFVDGLAYATPRLVLVTSSLNDRQEIHARLASLGYSAPEALGSRAFPFERLFAERFTPK